MNPKLILLFVLFQFSLSGWSQNYNVRIDGQIIGYDGYSELYYWLSSSNLSFESIKVKPDNLGRFTILKEILETKFFNIFYNNNGVYHACKLIVQPNNNYSFVSKGQKEADWMLHSSPDIYSWKKTNDNSINFYNLDIGQMYYNAIDNGTMGALYHEDWNLMDPESLLDTLQKRIKAKESVFFDLLIKGKINQEFYQKAKLNLEYLQAYRLAQTISDTWQMNSFAIKDTIVVNKLYSIYPKIFERYPVKNVKIEQVFCFDKYVDKYLLFLADYRDGTFNPQRRKGTAYLKPLENSKYELSAEADKIYTMRNAMSYTSSLDARSAQFAKDFLQRNPEMKDNQGGQFLEDVLIPRVEEFAKLADEEFAEGVIILDKNKPVASYQELLDSLKGKPFLIDYWGTWCAPCRYQFKYNDKLKPFLHENGIEMVYIAFEYDDSRKRWENFIKAFKLTGYHFISNDAFKSDFEKVAGKIEGFPTYIIVGADGKVLESKAFYPSDEEKLFIQLKEKLKNTL